MFIKSEMSSAGKTSPKSTLFTIENILKDTKPMPLAPLVADHGYNTISQISHRSADVINSLSLPSDDVIRSRVPTPERPLEVYPLPPRKRHREEDVDASRVYECVTPTSEIDDRSFSGCSRASTPSSCGQNSSFDDESMPTRKKKSRTCFSNQQLDDLEHAYLSQRYLPASERKQLAQNLKISDQQVKTWFQNRRMKEKRQVTGTRASPEAHQMAPFAMAGPMLPPGVFPQTLPMAVPSRLSPVPQPMPYPQFPAMPVTFAAAYTCFPQVAPPSFSPPQYPMTSLDLARHYANSYQHPSTVLPGRLHTDSSTDSNGVTIGHQDRNL